jgi:hypothetical protein
MTYLIYHPIRIVSKVSGTKVYHDSFSGNQDPYIWNKKFLHTFCHATQIPTKEKGQIHFWVSRDKSDKYPHFSKLYCDLVFVIDTVHVWKMTNFIDRQDPLVDTDLAFKYHYKWGNLKPKQSHYFRNRQRYTFKANSKRSFQPQDINGNLIDIIPFLEMHNIELSTLQQNISLTSNGKKAIPSRPHQIDSSIGQQLYDYLYNIAAIKLTGPYLANKHPKP